ncbi:MAG: NADPH--hemoprotein reductase, partial [Sediminibacterium sp.]|nr:NADPH--hemoprotein reductase [Sediminibacterium sp.]
MLTGPKLKILQDLVNNASREELIWMNGYVSGLIKDGAAIHAGPTNAVSKKMTIVYGTETGNSKRVAIDLATRARKQNLAVKLASLDQYRLHDLTKEENLFVVISTQGDGEPPVAAQKFYDHIHLNGFRLDNVKYSVLALGDTSYPLFCKTGEEVDEQLQKLGATRIVPIRKCDLEYDADAEAWFSQVLETLDTIQVQVAAPPVTQPATAGAIKSNKKIYTATVLTNINLHDRGASKETYHLELEAGEEVDYLPGDSIGIVPGNAAAAVNAVVEQAGIDREKKVTYKETAFTILELLTKKLNIIHLHERVVKKYAAVVQQEIPEVKMDLLDLLKLYPLANPAQFEEVLQILPVQSPRIYTIASSNAAHNGEVHLTVEKYAFTIHEAEKFGVCSDYLSQLQVNDQFEFFVQKNKRFRLPAADKDVIMIGPGTGIAAFRSFLAERDATGANGKNWLFFGEQHFVSDFLYQTEIQDWFSTGLLTRVNLAFSHDQPERLYVHHKMVEHGKDLYEWISSGAYLYVCGEKAPMSIEVEEALLQI